MIGNTVKCCYCNFELFDEDETIITIYTPLQRKFYIITRLLQIWIHQLNSTARCVSCDAVIGAIATIFDPRNLISIWNGKTENEEI